MESIAIVVEVAVSLAMAAVIYARCTSPRWRGCALGVTAAALLALEFGAIHFGVNVYAKHMAAS